MRVRVPDIHNFDSPDPFARDSPLPSPALRLVGSAFDFGTIPGEGHNGGEGRGREYGEERRGEREYGVRPALGLRAASMQERRPALGLRAVSMQSPRPGHGLVQRPGLEQRASYWEDRTAGLGRDGAVAPEPWMPTRMTMDMDMDMGRETPASFWDDSEDGDGDEARMVGGPGNNALQGGGAGMKRGVSLRLRDNVVSFVFAPLMLFLVSEIG